MEICSICVKPIPAVLQHLPSSMTDMERVTLQCIVKVFLSSGDWCMGHTAIRQPVPQAFYDAFKDDENEAQR